MMASQSESKNAASLNGGTLNRRRRHDAHDPTEDLSKTVGDYRRKGARCHGQKAGQESVINQVLAPTLRPNP